jgi:PAS domain-containing protein
MEFFSSRPRNPSRACLLGVGNQLGGTSCNRSEVLLRQSEERFRLLVHGVKEYAIFMLDPDGRVSTWNTGAERIKGYRAEEIIGVHYSRFFPPEDLATANRIEAAAAVAGSGGRGAGALRGGSGSGRPITACDEGGACAGLPSDPGHVGP